MKIAIYSRKSKYTGKGDSIGNQIQMCKDYIETHYRNNDPEYIIFYIYWVCTSYSFLLQGPYPFPLHQECFG